MAKPRKSKNDDQKVENLGGVVRHQKLCLSIDMEKGQIYGYTELKIAVPESGIVGLHAENMKIDKVSVDGEPAEYEFSRLCQAEDGKRGWHFVSSTTFAADAACSTYLSSLDREMSSNLLIKCCKPAKIVSEPEEHANGQTSTQHSGEPKQNLKLVRVDYCVEKAESGIHFSSNVLHTNNQIRRARCWFPCMDSSSQRCCYDLEFTVAQNLVAVSNGRLLHQVLSKDDPPRKTYVYRLDVPVTAGWISLAVAPFEILPDRHGGVVSHMCLPPNLSKLRNTVGFFHTAFSHYEEYLSAPFPFGSYKQVFIAPEIAISSLSLGASMVIFTAQVLFDEKVIDQTIDTRIKLAFALARQWFGVYITAESPNDEWLLDGLAGFLTDLFIKRFLGNNEARYRRYKANCNVCKADVNGATALSTSASLSSLYGTQCIGLYGKIRSWKSVAVLQMLEKQMGPESFRKILQTIILRAQHTAHPMRTLSTKEFRQFANKVGNLERPFLKEFFPRWVGSCGCPVLRMGLSYNKRKNLIELAVLRGCTAMLDSITSIPNGIPESETREGDVGWPGMMSIRVHELDGMYDHPILPMAGESWQLLEIQLHSKLAARRTQKPKKGSKPDGSDDNGEVAPSVDIRSNAESPLLWIRADPEMEYLAEINFNQPIQMWINQLEKEKDVVAQSQAIAMLGALPELSFSVMNALNNILCDSKAFWRVRIEAAFALAHTASEETDWAGLLHLVKFYKNRRFDPNIGLPRPNDFHDFPEYFVLEAIPQAIATVRAADNKSPREAVEFVLQLLKYNDNNGNSFSDVYWLAALVESVGELEFGQQSMPFLSSLLKCIDRLLQFDRLMPSYNGILTISCIRTLTQIALKLSEFIPLDHVFQLIKPFQNFETNWHVRIEASRALLDLEFHCKGIDAALSLFVKYLEEELSLRGQVKLAVHAMRFCHIRRESGSDDEISSLTLVTLLNLLESHKAFNNVFLRHCLFCILQILAGRPPTLYGVPRIQLQPMGDKLQPMVDKLQPMDDRLQPTGDLGTTSTEPKNKPSAVKLRISKPQDPSVDIQRLSPDGLHNPEGCKDTDTISNGNERRMPVVKIKVRHQSVTSSRAEDAENTVDKSKGGHNENERDASSSMSVDAPQRITNELVSTSNQNVEDVHSRHDRGSRMTASIGSTKLVNDDDGKELQCTADSRKGASLPRSDDRSSPGLVKGSNGETDAHKYGSLQLLPVGRQDQDGAAVSEGGKSREREKKIKDKEKKRKQEDKDEHKGHHDDPEYLERKRQKKKKKKQKEKEMAKLLGGEAKASVGQLQHMDEIVKVRSAKVELKPTEHSESKVVIKSLETKSQTAEGHKLRIKFKNRSLNKSE